MQQTGLPSDEYAQYNHWGEILCVSFLKPRRPIRIENIVFLSSKVYREGVAV